MGIVGRTLAFGLSLGAGAAAVAQVTAPPGSAPPAGAPPTSFQTTSPEATSAPSVAADRAATQADPPRPVTVGPVLPPATAPRVVSPLPSSRLTPLLPAPTDDPLRIDVGADPILRLARTQASREEFLATIGSAVERHPGTQELEAMSAEARAIYAEAEERRLPSIDLNVSSYRVISREFSNDQQNIVERSRPSKRTDAQLTVQHTIFDFGASGSRVAAAGARLRAAAADAEAGADRIALGAVGAWYDVFAARALVAVTEGFVSNQQELRDAVEERIRSGVSAPGDTARVESYLASAQTRLARFRRLLSTAEARFAELTGTPTPAELERAPVAELPAMTKDAAALAAMGGPGARAAQAAADAARQEAKAARRDRFPQFGVGIDAGRYGVFETDKDYDIRGRVTMRQRLFGGTEARVAQADARVLQADARATRSARKRRATRPLPGPTWGRSRSS
jgi:adhesin transport system outer membrane protein